MKDGNMSKEVKTLEGISDGVWNVYTETSMYVIDLDKKLGKREPGKGLGPSSNSSRNQNMKASEMRADGEWFQIKGVYCEVGPSMTILCEGIVPADIFTLRQTTWVRKIEKVEQ
jgi:hypothetical protein